MKLFNTSLYTIAASVLLFAGCKKGVDYDTQHPVLAEFANIYIPQGVQGLVDKKVAITETPDTLLVNGFLGGVFPASDDIALQVAADPKLVNQYNADNGTNYLPLPVESYEVVNDKVVIHSGSNRSESVQIKIKKWGIMDPFVSYLLPITLSKPSGAKEKLDTVFNKVFFRITGSYAPGQVPRKKVASIGKEKGTMLVDFGNKFLLVDKVSKNLMMYTPDAEGVFNAPPKEIGQGFDVFNALVYFNKSKLLGRYKDGDQDIIQFPLTENGVIHIPDVRVIGWGWNVFKDLFTFKNLVIGRASNGDLTKLPLDAFGNWDFGAVSGIGAGWGIFNQVFSYGNSLLGVKPNGDLVQYPITDNGVIGSGSNVGSGWNQYVKIIPSGTDLLCLDAEGNLYRYEFNPAGFWPL